MTSHRVRLGWKDPQWVVTLTLQQKELLMILTEALKASAQCF